MFKQYLLRIWNLLVGDIKEITIESFNKIIKNNV